MNRFLIIPFMLLVFLSACMYPVYEPIPLHDADLYPGSQTKAGVSVAVDRVADPERVRQYFGADLISADVLPINIIVSNHGRGRYIVRPSDVLIYGKDVIEPVPVKTVERTIIDEYGLISEESASRVNGYFSRIMLKETVLAPDENYQGMMFVKTSREKDDFDREGFSPARLFEKGSLKVRVAVTDFLTRERVHFGPFSLAAP